MIIYSVEGWPQFSIEEKQKIIFSTFYILKNVYTNIQNLPQKSKQQIQQ